MGTQSFFGGNTPGQDPWALRGENDGRLARLALVQTGAWPGYTPVVTQSTTPTLTVNYAHYTRIDRTIIGSAYVTITGTGTASNKIVISLPVAAATGTANVVVGSGWILDASAGAMYKAVVEINDVGLASVQFRPASSTGNDVLGSSIMTAALANGDLVNASFTYEAAAS